MMRILLAAVLLLLAAPTWAQPCMTRGTTGRLEPRGNCPDPDEDGSFLSCSVGATGGVACTWHRPPLLDVQDANGDPLTGDPSITVLRILESLDLSEPDTGTAGVDISPSYLPTYTTTGLDAMGALTTDQNADVSGVIDFDTLPTQANGEPMNSGYVMSFLCSTVNLNATKYYCSIAADSTATTTQNDAETLAALPCTKVRKVAFTLLTSATRTSAELPSSCTLTSGFSVDNSDTGTLCTVLASTGVLGCTPSSTASWTITNERSLWVQSSGGGCSGSRNLRVEIGCW